MLGAGLHELGERKLHGGTPRSKRTRAPDFTAFSTSETASIPTRAATAAACGAEAIVAARISFF